MKKIYIYLGIVMDEHLTFKNHMDTVKLKLHPTNGLLAKLRHYVNPILLRTIYYAMFESHLWYGCQLWGQTQTQVLQIIEKIQNKALRITNFKNPWEPHSVHPPPLSAVGSWTSYQIFKKRRFDRTSTLRGGFLEKRWR